ncbi:MAG: DUF1080 domain-containing protein [Gemmatimonadota bacterium]|nr:DUF1080 domain-containing protein [Gemmatimonadota bacterium]
MSTLKLTSALFLSAVLFLSCTSRPEFVPLFDGETMTGWHAEGGETERWSVEDGVLSCIEGGGGWLTTDSEYSDFILSLEWRIPPGGNSGVGLRYPPDCHVSRTGMEIQILDDEAEKYRDIKPEQFIGSIYYQVAAKKGAAKPPGQWNRFLITCDGPLVVVELNGVEITRARMDEFTVGKGNLTPLSERPRKGHIGLQSHGKSRVDFRNIEIKVLERQSGKR